MQRERPAIRFLRRDGGSSLSGARVKSFVDLGTGFGDRLFGAVFQRLERSLLHVPRCAMRAQAPACCMPGHLGPGGPRSRVCQSQLLAFVQIDLCQHKPHHTSLNNVGRPQAP